MFRPGGKAAWVPRTPAAMDGRTVNSDVETQDF
jgi:hypothetical protein